MVFFHKNWRLRRSVLFMPSSNRRVLEKAPDLDCDSLIFDLEDSVAEEKREEAHQNLREMVAGKRFGNRETVIRLSQTDSSSFDADLAVALECGVNALLLPKVDSARQIYDLEATIMRSETLMPQLWAMIETPKALMNLQAICETSASTSLSCLIVGPNDLAKETGAKMEPGRAVMLPWLMQVLANARAYDLCVLDGVYNNFRDLDGFAAECQQGASMGYDGKTLIHPSQCEAANLNFGFAEQELDRSRAIVAAFAIPENAHKGAINLDGEMVERLHLDIAQQMLEAAEMTAQ